MVTEIKLFQRAKCKMQYHLSILKTICDWLDHDLDVHL